MTCEKVRSIEIARAEMSEARMEEKRKARRVMKDGEKYSHGQKKYAVTGDWQYHGVWAHDNENRRSHPSRALRLDWESQDPPRLVKLERSSTVHGLAAE